MRQDQNLPSKINLTEIWTFLAIAILKRPFLFYNTILYGCPNFQFPHTNVCRVLLCMVPVNHCPILHPAPVYWSTCLSLQLLLTASASCRYHFSAQCFGAVCLRYSAIGLSSCPLILFGVFSVVPFGINTPSPLHLLSSVVICRHILPSHYLLPNISSSVGLGTSLYTHTMLQHPTISIFIIHPGLSIFINIFFPAYICSLTLHLKYNRCVYSSTFTHMFFFSWPFELRLKKCGIINFLTNFNVFQEYKICVSNFTV